jgi:large subunit ribosomal protein L9e
VKVNAKSRKVTVTGPKGEITKNFRHMPVELSIKAQNVRKRKGQFLNIKMYFASKKQACSVSTLKSLIKNMIIGVTDVRFTSILTKDATFYAISNSFSELIIIIDMILGLQIQNEIGSRSFPNQRHHSQGWKIH